METFTDGQWKSLAIVPHFSSALSIMGNAWVIFDILVRRKKMNKLPLTTYHRLILGMSIWDLIVVSLGKFPASWAMPVDPEANYAYASGSRQTCTMQGFFVQLGLIVPLYNGMTAWYYLLVIHYSMGNKCIHKRFEKWMHLCPFIVALSLAMVGLMPSMLLYSPSTMWCWINAEPKGCMQSYQSPTADSVTCTRGDNAFIFRLAFYYAPIWAIIIFAAISMLVMWNSVRVQVAHEEQFYDQHMSRYMTRSETMKRKRKQKHKDIARQAFFYIGGFFVVWTIPTVNRILGFFYAEKIYLLSMLHSILSPLQGFVNFLVYIRPRLIHHINQHTNLVVSDGEVKRSTAVAVVAFFFFSDKTTLVKKTGNGITQLTPEEEQPQGNNSEVEEEVAEDYGA